jgi:serine/threonine protein kinase
MFIPKVNEAISIGSEVYHFTAHPAAPDMPYGQTGRKATVFQLAGRDGRKRALKVFTARYRLEENIYKTGEMLKYAVFPGLAICERFVISKYQFPSLIQQKRDLDCSVLMPWVDGQTWQDYVLNKYKMNRDTCLENALELNKVLASMEISNVAHCDLSGPNIILRPVGMTDKDEDPISLIDLEEMYAPDLTRPKILPAGSAGYAHSTASKGLWSQYADRFAGSILLANMLTWCDDSVVNASYGENYFSPDEMHTNCTRYQIISSSLEKNWGKPASDLFSCAWYSRELEACPSFADWASAFNLEIEEIVIPTIQPRTKSPQQPQPNPQAQPVWEAIRQANQAQSPLSINSNSHSPVVGFKPLYNGQSYSPRMTANPATPNPQPIIEPGSLRSDFTEMNRLSDWREVVNPQAINPNEPQQVKIESTEGTNKTNATSIIIFLVILVVIILIAIFSGSY